MWTGDDKMAAVRELSCLCNRVLAVRSRCHLPLGLGLVSSQRRTFSISAAVTGARDSQELENNPYYSKYQARLRELRRTRPDDYEARVAKKEEMKRQPLGYSKQAEFIKQIEQESKGFGKMAQGNGSGQGHFTKDKTLHSILNLDMIKEKTPSEINQIWNQYFAQKNTISAVIPGAKFDLMRSRGQNCPTFLYALPREAGYEFFVGQWSGTQLHFSSLINIQSLGQNAPSQLIIYHYPELQKEKDIVLLTAEIDTQFLGTHEAQCLANQAELFYGTDCQEIFNLVKTFNHKPNEFKHTSVIAEIERLGFGGMILKQNSEA
uniref:ATP synthase mitochondrial F1 complex assembly factor 1 n=1 Tax=Callorhinchus milii TaxID=7868 RepID=V9L180_CALMI|eukprot:gi/632940294/ref/XP_007885241.1/ PREDICTED: ATP synthase mitochondrial F1 complex assembly factor 1 [Callorhinchus milii]